MKYSKSLNSREQVDELAVAPDRALNRSISRPLDLQSSEPRVAAPAQERLDPRRQLTDFERLHQVICRRPPSTR